MAIHIHLRHISKHFGSHTALDQLSLSVKAGELVTLLGPSGCGKTTLLRIIAGLEAPDGGEVLFDGVDVAKWNVRERKVGFVFQNYALFRHMTVEQNVTFGMRMQPRKVRLSAPCMRQKAQELLRLVQLDDMAERYPRGLSGGQQQRVALARALAIEPRVLLLDEPFGALDAKVRKELRECLRQLQQAVGITCIMVTHDQDEALDISDRIVILNQGRVEQQGTPDELSEHPANPFTLNFLGTAHPLSSSSSGLAPHGPTAFVRPHEIQVERAGASSTTSSAKELTADISHILIRGPTARLRLANAGNISSSSFIEAEISRETLARLSLKVGDKVSWRPTRLHVFAQTDTAVMPRPAAEESLP